MSYDFLKLSSSRSLSLLIATLKLSRHLLPLLLLVTLLLLPRSVTGDAETRWSFKIGNFDLFDVPAFGRSLIGGDGGDIVTENYAGINGLSRPQFEIDPNIIEDSFLKTPELILKYDHPAEVHHVVTDDGYILELHRIVRKSALPVLLVHGLLDTSATWVMMGPDKGLAYLLYDIGYDVWMANVRGNTYSRNHTEYRTHEGKFWKFSFHEMGKYDLPATIDYVLKVNGHERLHYIGHSQGNLIFWVMCSERPEYAKKILLMQALAPVAFVKHCKSPIVEFLAFFQYPLKVLLKLIGAHEFLPSNEFLMMFNQILCDDIKITKDICRNTIFLVTGFDREQMNETMLPVALGHAPAGASTKQMLHFGQLMRSGHFRQYDYGRIHNYFHYGSISPPEYKLSNVFSKVALHYSQNDWVSTPVDVEHLHLQLPNVVGKFLVNYKKFNHLDFVWGIDARELLYQKVIKLMELVERGEF